MRDKEAMEIEKKSFMRMLEKQGKAVEKLVDTEGSLQAQIVRLYVPGVLNFADV
jgi:E3 ubiquitin-protein ligase BRE1